MSGQNKYICTCGYCGFSEKKVFTRCPKCNESQYIKKVKIVNYYKEPEEKKESVDYSGITDYYNMYED